MRLRDDPAGPRFGEGLVGLANPTRQVADGRTTTEESLGAKAQSPVCRSVVDSSCVCGCD